MLKTSIAILLLSISEFGLAVDFSTADALFRERTEGLAKTLAAKEAYTDLIPESNGDDKIYAVSQVARLEYFHGEVIIPRNQKPERARIFKRCLEDIERISPTSIGRALEAYFNWKMTCVTLYMESASGTDPSRTSELKLLIKKSLEFTTNSDDDYVGTYEGAAIARYIAAIYSNPNARIIGLYKPVKALKLIRAAVASDYHESRAYPEPLSGADYYENAFVMVDVLKENNMSSAAMNYLDDAIEEIEDLRDSEELPNGRETETLQQLGRLIRLRDQGTH